MGESLETKKWLAARKKKTLGEMEEMFYEKPS